MDGKPRKYEENRVCRYGEGDVDFDVFDVSRKGIVGRFGFGQGVIGFKDWRGNACSGTKIASEAKQKYRSEKSTKPAREHAPIITHLTLGNNRAVPRSLRPGASKFIG